MAVRINFGAETVGRTDYSTRVVPVFINGAGGLNRCLCTCPVTRQWMLHPYLISALTGDPYAYEDWVGTLAEAKELCYRLGNAVITPGEAGGDQP